MDAVAVRIFANSRNKVESVFCVPGWDIYESDNPDCPDFGIKLRESDIDNQEPWLEALIYTFIRKSESKESFPVKGQCEGEIEYRNLWARNLQELRDQFPTLELHYLVPWDPNCLHSDIDIEDEFVSKYRVKDT